MDINAGNKPEQIFAIAQSFIHEKVFLKSSVRERRLRHHAFQPGMLNDCQFGGPIRAETLPVHCDSVLSTSGLSL